MTKNDAAREMMIRTLIDSVEFDLSPNDLHSITSLIVDMYIFALNTKENCRKSGAIGTEANVTISARL